MCTSRQDGYPSVFSKMVSSRTQKLGKVGMASKLFTGLMPDLIGDVQGAPLHDPTGRKPRGKRLKINTKIEKKDDKQIYRKPAAAPKKEVVSKEVAKQPASAPTKASFHHVRMNPCPHSYT